MNLAIITQKDVPASAVSPNKICKLFDTFNGTIYQMQNILL